jgi:hypothetical protein
MQLCSTHRHGHPELSLLLQCVLQAMDSKQSVDDVDLRTWSPRTIIKDLSNLTAAFWGHRIYAPYLLEAKVISSEPHVSRGLHGP